MPNHESSTETNTPRLTIKQRLVRWTKRAFKATAMLFLGYAFAVLVGLIPVNNDFIEATDGIEIFVTSNPVHSDLLLPISTQSKNWLDRFPADDFVMRSSQATYVGVGWGDRGFYVHTPTWEDLKASTTLNALLIPSSTVMHVGFFDKPVENENTRKVKISAEQYHALVKYVEQSFKLDSFGDFLPIKNSGYGVNDAFYEANGSYHAFNTCNCWIGGALRAAGVRAGCFTPLPKTVFLYLP